MKLSILFLLLGVALLAQNAWALRTPRHSGIIASAAPPCNSFANETSCDAIDTCVWCNLTVSSSPVGSCYSKKAAKFLPKIFSCGADVTKAQVPLMEEEDVVKVPKSNCSLLLNDTACDLDATCVWCNMTFTKTPGAGKCFPEIATKFLPPVFKCPIAIEKDSKDAGVVSPIDEVSEKSVSNCTYYLNETSCSDDATCVWCNMTFSKTPGAGKCFSAAASKFLPPIFACSAPSTDAVVAESKPELSKKRKPFVNCYNATNLTTCHDVKGCVWCSSVWSKTGMCIPTTASKTLPKQIFKCDKKRLEEPEEASAVLEAPYVACPSFTNDTACDAQDTCAWCVSGAKGACYPTIVTKYLPPTVVCDAKNNSIPDGDGKTEDSEENADVTIFKGYSDVVTVSPSTTCSDFKNETACGAAAACVWCNITKAITPRGSCFSTVAAQFLPPSVFTCSAPVTHVKAEAVPTEPAPSVPCSSLVDETGCEADAACVWCNITASPLGKGSCFSAVAAQFLPPSVFTCSAVAPADDTSMLSKSLDSALEASFLQCLKQKSAAACDAMSACVWCNSSSLGAFGNGCYPMFLSKFLPRGFFTCDSPSPSSLPIASSVAATFEVIVERSSVGGSICDAKKTAAACTGPECVWCTSAAVGGGCYTPAEAARLPKSIFKCNS